MQNGVPAMATRSKIIASRSLGMSKRGRVINYIYVNEYTYIERVSFFHYQSINQSIKKKGDQLAAHPVIT